LVRLKFAGELGLVGVLGWMMAEAVQARGLAADVVVPVPMRPQGVVERGFNQSVELGRMLSRRMGWPMRQVLTKIRDTERQARLSCAERQVNVGGAFVSAPVPGLRVAVVDDIMTTGATARACAWALKATGAREVWCAVVARA
jgi:predicted amidophosphoribosyltransferase